MNREQFAALLEKYQEGRCTEQEKQLVEHWFALLENENGEEVSKDELNGAEERMWAGMQERADLPDLRERDNNNPFRSIYIRWAGMAASLLLIGWFFAGKIFDRHVPLTAYTWEEKRNDGPDILPVMLEDSSVVELRPGSSLRYPNRFEGSKREVVLKGDGFFSIRKNSQKPFYVHSGGVTTRVLGTSFHVTTASDGLQTKVEVVTGLVSVYSEKTSEEAVDMLISPNHTATFDRNSGKFTPGLSEHPRLLNTHVSFQFHNAPLAQVAQHMRDAWGVTVEAEDSQIMNCPLTADLSGQPLYTQLDIICAALGAKYKVRGSTIRIAGPGCKMRGTTAFQTRKPSPMQT
ncbi:ferric-dicitrate binding protein FerR (iron transport regulator) [Dyadobacter sp. BE34]|uniref:Ferric-dicitrate binding protein FerR (Iron transport regulator) n=1 Tax=Dyadobacter fermentans TaxID=94254 RepID=A0ABU1QVH5_9BACT|nr:MULTISPECIES: FecR domain-containing protein [Dyadobacter]MDR6805154.1 ferric-dicitrate binding protein FerR (iron transport regulator) [Dyadobacter fermentans]MDR7043087.1 ferric-dicitrate binding protein FerR (iron transport regulator) [Dyadobacter sp. BE242]MDR7197399.1 ferric-dicitrate binding protein FerR (iron transport regulator) [Dyadobacter sp. BE34]MDR7215168.1 ferric-dicitrate binding protein FerR (iron transport regulator) [Dyadobacter sp. BE31]MDR7262703.1 ferric-dicitrate bind